MNKHWLTLVPLLTAIIPASAQSGVLDRVDEALAWKSPNGWFRADASGLLDLETYYIDQRPPGLLFPDDDWFFNPRLSLFLDIHMGHHLYAFAQARFDRGFDPGARPDGASRLDEYLLRYTPFDDSRVNVQVGKFATVVGNWVQRHDSWNNPFITAPVPYENVMTMSDGAAPAAPGGFVGRRNLTDLKGRWLPIVWGPAYTSGASVFGKIERFNYAFEFKNASISSRPTVWDATNLSWEHPTISGRLGYQPAAAWDFGVSFSHGTYMLPVSEKTLPAGKTLDDFNQLTVAYDASYSWHHWQLWGEFYFSRFDVPNVGPADTAAWYLEAKYKITPSLFAAVRFN
ncbi:MAG TPA: hypothetical protein VK968_15270, partial [Roseimicrobium sp.]|nr:hypothetical protein [Roseimicrobium sp.]